MGPSIAEIYNALGDKFTYPQDDPKGLSELWKQVGSIDEVIGRIPIDGTQNYGLSLGSGTIPLEALSFREKIGLNAQLLLINNKPPTARGKMIVGYTDSQFHQLDVGDVDFVTGLIRNPTKGIVVARNIPIAKGGIVQNPVSDPIWAQALPEYLRFQSSRGPTLFTTLTGGEAQLVENILAHNNIEFRTTHGPSIPFPVLGNSGETIQAGPDMVRFLIPKQI
jgi:hypothetical protein